MADSFIPDSFEPDRPLSAAGTPLPRTLADLKSIPSAPISKAAESERGDSFVADSFVADKQVLPNVPGFKPDPTPMAIPEVRTTGAPPEEQGLLWGLLSAPGKRLEEAYNDLTKAGTPGGGFWPRVGAWASGAGKLASVPFTYGEYAGGKAGEALYSTRPFMDDMTDEALTKKLENAKLHAPGEVPLYERLLATPYEQRIEQTKATGKFVGETVGSNIGPLSAVSAVRRALPKRVPALPTEVPNPVSTAVELPGRMPARIPGHVAQYEEELATIQQRQAALANSKKGSVVDPIMGDTVNRKTMQDRIAEQMVRIKGMEPDIASTPTTQRGGIEQTLDAARRTQIAPQSNPTLEAAKDLGTGRRLDLGSVGRKRAAAREAGAEAPAETEFYRPESIRSGVEPTEAPPLTPPDNPAPTPKVEGPAEPKGFRARWLSKEGIAVAKTKAELPSILGFTPSDIAKGIPEAEALVSKMQERSQAVQSIHANLVSKVRKAYEGLDEAGIMRVNKLLDTPGGTSGVAQLAPAEQKAYGAARQLLDDLAESVGVDSGKRVTDYFPRIREQLGIESRKIIRLKGEDVPTYMTETTPRRVLKEWFEKGRKTDAPAENLGLEPMLEYARGASRRIGYGGGKDPRTGEVLSSVLQDIEPNIQKIPSRLADYYTTYVNDVIGIPRGQGAPGISHETASNLKTWEFNRTIGGSPVSPVVNLLQQGLTLAEVNPKNFALAYKDVISKLRNPAELQKLREAGVIDQLSAADHDFLNAAQRRGVASRIASKTGVVFQATERINRAHAYYAGLREAASMGLEGAKAEAFAKNIVKKTQFLFDKSDMPEGFRNPLSRHAIPALWQTSSRQYKNFPIKYGLALKNMVADDLKNLPTFAKALASGDGKAMYAAMPTKTGKFALGTGALFGSDAITAGYDRAIFGDGHFWQTPGAVGYLGMALGHQAGLGAIPIEDVNSILFFLPGPLLAHAMDAASAAFSVTSGKDIDFSATSLGRGEHVAQNLGQLAPADPEKVARQFVRSIPIAGTSLDRVRQAVITAMSQDPSMVRKPLTYKQAFAMEPVGLNNPARRPIPGGHNFLEAGKDALGVVSTRQDETQKLRTALMNETKATDKLSHRAAQLIIGGKSEEAYKLLRDAGVPVTPQALRRAVEAAAMEPAMSQALRTRMLQRGRALERLQDLPGGIAP